jgi:hypothetical protein
MAARHQREQRACRNGDDCRQCQFVAHCAHACILLSRSKKRLHGGRRRCQRVTGR